MSGFLETVLAHSLFIDNDNNNKTVPCTGNAVLMLLKIAVRLICLGYHVLMAFRKYSSGESNSNLFDTNLLHTLRMKLKVYNVNVGFLIPQHPQVAFLCL